MAQFPHDEFVKEIIPELYKNYGQVIPSADVSSERREIDVLFIPNQPVPTSPETLGLLGRLAQTTCLIEVYRNAVNSDQIMDCLGKLVSVKNTQFKQTQKVAEDKKKVMLWIITPTISQRNLRKFGATLGDNWESGVYFAVEGLNTGIIAVHQLPKTRATLWLRLFGREKIQFEEIEELESLPNDYPDRKTILKSVYGLLSKIKANQNKSSGINQQKEVLMMSLKAIFDEELAKEKQQGRQEGRQEGIQEGIQQGEIRGKLKTVPLLIQLGMKVEEIANQLDLPVSEVTKAINSEQN